MSLDTRTVTEKVLAANRIAANFPRRLNPSIQLPGDSGRQTEVKA
jgi:hypothetical protein